MRAKRTTSRKSGGAAFTLAAGLSPSSPLALPPAVTGGLPFSRVLAITEAKTVPCCIACHSNSKSDDLGEVPNCFLQEKVQNTARLRSIYGVRCHQTSMIWSLRVPTLT